MRFSAILLLVALLTEGVFAAGEAAPPRKGAPSIDVVFVLDTTGSMGGLLDGAKKKVWSIVNDLAKGKPTPKIRIGLVAYRDRGDAYVTQVEPLTANLDAVYEKLLALRAEGGGDGPEDVLGALRDAVDKTGWSDAPRTLKIIFLVGDAPPHLDYTDVPPYPRTVESAVRKDIRIHTIRCGSAADTGEIWQKIARLGEGKFFTIDQGGGVRTVETPFDRSIAELQARLDGTGLAYGTGAAAAEARADMERSAKFVSAAPAAAMAARAEYKSKAGFPGERDLLSAVDGGKVKLDEVKEEALPDALKGKSLKEREAELAKIRGERARLQAQMAELSKKRAAFIKEAEAKEPVKKDGFDAKVTETLREQASSIGIKY